MRVLDESFGRQAWLLGLAGLHRSLCVIASAPTSWVGQRSAEVADGCQQIDGEDDRLPCPSRGFQEQRARLIPPTHAGAA
jgi:hypothetical protein